MGGGDPEYEEDWVGSSPPPLAGVKLADAPILFFVFFHKAFRLELVSLHRAAAEHVGSGSYSREVVVDLTRSLEFLKLVYSYHCVAEDEVIFPALDAKVKNVVTAYSLEHKSIDDKFNSIFYHLDLLMNKDYEHAPPILQEIIFSIGTIQTIICQHMQKEEEQVFPLLIQKFTFEEQSQLVWQYICSVPIILLEDFFPWLDFYLSSDERVEFLECLLLVISEERVLQEVVTSWFPHESETTCSHAYSIYGKRHRFLNGLSGCQDILNLYPPKEACSIHATDFQEPIKEISKWHDALRGALHQILEELYEIRNSNCNESLSSVLLQIKFIADILIFYSDYLDKVFYPFIRHLSENGLSPCSQLIEEVHVKGLQRLLYHETQGLVQVRGFTEMLCNEVESLVIGFNKNLVLLETEVLPFVGKTCTSEAQLWLLYTGLQMMPLGMLRCTLIWFSSHLSEIQLNSILKNIQKGSPAVTKSFTSLLHEWVRLCCSGKTSVEKFTQNLEEFFGKKNFYFVDPNSAIELPKSNPISSSSVTSTAEEHDLSYPSSMNLDIFFSVMFKRISSVEHDLAQSKGSTALVLEKRPMDLIIYIHRALVKDLEYLVSLSMKLATSSAFFTEFKNQFRVFHNMYQTHSKSEDEIVFPFLESKGALRNISGSYCIDHKLEVKQFNKTSRILDEISKLQDEDSNETRLNRYRLCLKLQDACLSLHKVLSDHISREEVEIFPLFGECFSFAEEEKVVGHILGKTRAEVLQEMIPWLMAYLTSDEQQNVMTLWRNVARNTKFDEWLGEWWEGINRYNISNVGEGSRPSPSMTADPLEVVSKYLLKGGAHIPKILPNEFTVDCLCHNKSGKAGKRVLSSRGKDGHNSQELNCDRSEIYEKGCKEMNGGCDEDEMEVCGKECQKLSHQMHPLCMNQDELEAAIRRVSRDSSLDSQKKSYVIQNLLMSRWIIKQKMSQEEDAHADNEEKIPGQNPSYRDNFNLTFGCKHYKRNCKLFAPCCNKLYACIRCHDDLTDHSIDRKTITKMMCMKCLAIQPIGPKCISPSCNGFSMGKYYCRICRLFDDERQIYHCPYCNLCRVGKGLGIDYFHCMICNACMSRSLLVHVCREKCLEDNCPICHEYIFTSSAPVKALPCGHLMHSACFQDYTCSHYICPICSKSLGDMQVYFGMLDALLAEEKVPEEYSGQMQIILCNDCEKRGTASFHWLYHKCPHCGSYNTRLL